MADQVVDIAVVPVAGRGTRLLPMTKSQPKEMLPVGRKPVVQYVVEELVRCGIKRFLFITGPGKTAIENHFDLNPELIQMLRETGKEELLRELAFERAAVDYFYTRQRRQLGLGHAVLCAEPMVDGQPFVVALGDSIIGLQAQSDIVARMIAVFETEKADAVIAFETVPREDVIYYGIAEPEATQDTNGHFFALKGIIEKPSPETAPSCLAVAARYVFSPVIFTHLKHTKPGKGEEIQLTDAIQRLIESGGKVLGMRLPEGERRFDIGNFESYFRAFVEFALADEEYGEGLR
ncbi:MAG TPA: UTP--glucose-1-phosphate uridylyltransferase, partial [Thermogutta sp.]|nr:UTP--glucose-1-phosphate uridylyltransferase [Thermogutta sp.]HPU07586.1 UTP--glucose-1-phosphate uridylyltransferase [Thermogutta sp.]